MCVTIISCIVSLSSIERSTWWRVEVKANRPCCHVTCLWVACVERKRTPYLVERGGSVVSRVETEIWREMRGCGHIYYLARRVCKCQWMHKTSALECGWLWVNVCALRLLWWSHVAADYIK